MKNWIKILIVTVSMTLSNLGAAGETTVLKYHSPLVKHEIYVTDGKVVGGKSLGGSAWQVSGGAYDGKYLHVTFTSAERSGCKSWFTHIYEVNETGPRMLINVDKCGSTQTDLKKQHSWDYDPGYKALISESKQTMKFN